jgi:hypothetical protein
MTLTISGSPADIAHLLNRFSPKYHVDFLTVRRLGRAYLAAPHPGAAAAHLAPALASAMRSWGAGFRKAPSLQSVQSITATLTSSTLHASMVALQYALRAGPNIVAGSRVFTGLGAPPLSVQSFDSHLFNAMERVSRGLFVANTNVTYPMKAILMIAGLMPAFDRRVRDGLNRGGFAGMSSTRYLVPSAMSGTAWMKISRLPFFLGQCWISNRPRICAEIRSSHLRVLIAEPGRIFDILFFMQGDPTNPVVLTWRGSRRWYHLP